METGRPVRGAAGGNFSGVEPADYTVWPSRSQSFAIYAGPRARRLYGVADRRTQLIQLAQLEVAAATAERARCWKASDPAERARWERADWRLMRAESRLRQLERGDV